MATAITNTVDWKLIWAQRGFRYFFLAMFVSLFGSGMNFAGVSWYILTATHSTVKVSGQVIVMTLPGLFVPFLGGVLIDRIDRHEQSGQSHDDHLPADFHGRMRGRQDVPAHARKVHPAAEERNKHGEKEVAEAALRPD